MMATDSSAQQPIVVLSQVMAASTGVVVGVTVLALTSGATGQQPAYAKVLFCWMLLR
jgi:hypothetical protein